MARPVAWRQKPPDGFEELIAAVASTRMMLLQEIGPTSFVIKEAPREGEGVAMRATPAREQPSTSGADDDAAAVALVAGLYPATAAAAAAAAAAGGGGAAEGGGAREGRRRRAGEEKYKVQIGSSMKCSCKAKGGGPCLHLLFVLLKILRVPPENPFLWQGSLLDHEIDQVLRGRFQVAASKRKRAGGADAGKDGVQAKAIEPGDVCAICQEDLCDDEGEILTEHGPLVYCKQSCGNSVHAKCMKVWAEHKASVGDKITCPFCREDWGPGAVEDIKKEIRQSRRPPNVHYGITCAACKAGPITGNRFRCLVCADCDLCERCFSRHAHKEQGHPFVSRPTVDSNWVAATRPPGGRAAGRGRAASDAPEVPADLINDLQSRELGVEDYELLLQLDEAQQRAVPLHQHLAAALPRPSEAEVAAACARGDGLCGLCSTPICTGRDLSELRKAPCGSILHVSCLQAHLAQDSNLLCPCCSDPLFNGLRPPGRAPLRTQAHARTDGAQSTGATGAASTGAARNGLNAIQVGGIAMQVGGSAVLQLGAPRLRCMRERSPAARTHLPGALADSSIASSIAGGATLCMSVTGRHVGGDTSLASSQEVYAASQEVAVVAARTRRQKSHGGSTASSPGVVVGSAAACGGWHAGINAGVNISATGSGFGQAVGGVGGVGVEAAGVTAGDRIRAEPWSGVNARLQRARREARSCSLDPTRQSSAARGEGPLGLQVSSRHLAACGVALTPVGGGEVSAAGGGGGTDDLGPVHGALEPTHSAGHAITPAAAAALAAEARLAAAAAEAAVAAGDGAGGEGASAEVSPRAWASSSGGAMPDVRAMPHVASAATVPDANCMGAQHCAGALRQNSSARPPRPVHSRAAGGAREEGRRRGVGFLRDGGVAGTREEDVSSIYIGAIDVDGATAGNGDLRSVTARSAGAGGGAGRNRRRQSAASTPPSARPALDALGVGAGVASGESRTAGLLPGLVSAASPGLVSGVSHASHPQSRPASDPPGSSAAARTGESLRTREARDIRERDHLARVQSMVLGGNALSVVALGASAAAGVSGKVVSRVSGKVGRHASLTSVGRQHSGGGPLRPLILKNVAAGFYDTTLS